MSTPCELEAQPQPGEDWLWEEAVYPRAWMLLMAAARLGWESFSRAICCRAVAVRGKLAAQYTVYNANAVLLRKLFDAGSGGASEHTQVAGTDSLAADPFGTHRRTRFLFCHAKTGLVSERYPSGSSGGSHVHLPPNLTVYRQEGGAQLAPGRHLYFLYGASLSARALVNLVATERELNAGHIASNAWISFVRAKLASTRRTYGLLDAWRWLKAYELYFEGEAAFGLRLFDLFRL